MAVGAQGIGEDVRIAAVVLRAGDGEAVAEAVELLGVDRMDRKAALEQGLDHRPMRHLDGHRDRRGLAAGPGEQPLAQLGEAGAAVRKGRLAEDPAGGINEADLVRLAGPIDADEPSRNSLVRHRFVLPHRPDRRDARPSLYGRSWRDSPPDVRRGQPGGARVHPRRSQRRG
jgi:hypothetical protein